MTVNPLYIKTYKQANVLCDKNIIELITKKTLEELECPICYDKVVDTKICFPFKCQHPICFNCFRKSCLVYKNHSLNFKKNKVKCPQCRKTCINDWIIKSRCNSKFFVHNMIEIEIIIPHHS